MKCSSRILSRLILPRLWGHICHFFRDLYDSIDLNVPVLTRYTLLPYSPFILISATYISNLVILMHKVDLLQMTSLRESPNGQG